jgi:hypothetical protein
MLMFWDARLVLLSTPRTGSTALAEALLPRATLAIARPPVLKHTTLHRYHRFLGPYLRAASGGDFEVVALMREPRDWLASWYRYRTRGTEVEPGKSTRDIGFDAFVRAWCEAAPPPFAAVGSQARFLRSRKGDGAGRLFRYEDMPAVLDFLSRRLGGPVVLPRRNASPAVAGLDLTAQTEARLRQAAAEDFALYAAIPAVSGSAPGP